MKTLLLTSAKELKRREPCAAAVGAAVPAYTKQENLAPTVYTAHLDVNNYAVTDHRYPVVVGGVVQR